MKFEGNYRPLRRAARRGGSGVAGPCSAPPARLRRRDRQAVAGTVVHPTTWVPTLDDTVAVVIVEPVAANMGLSPVDGFLTGLRRCDASALLLFDEVITGFRLGVGGATGWSGVTPDLVLRQGDRGRPAGRRLQGVAAVVIARSGRCTRPARCREPAGPTAGLAVLSQLDASACERLATAALADGLSAFADAGVAAVVPASARWSARSSCPTPPTPPTPRVPVDFATVAASVDLGHTRRGSTGCWTTASRGSRAVRGHVPSLTLTPTSRPPAARAVTPTL